MSVHFLLIAVLIAFATLCLLSNRLRGWADLICFGMVGLYVHTLLLHGVKIEFREWPLLSASLFVLSFSFMRWTYVKSGQQDAGLRTQKPEESQNDISPLRQLADAEHENRLQTLGLMHAKLIHELSHPISTMTLRIDELRRKAARADDSGIEKSLASVQRQLLHMTSLLEPLRAFAANQQTVHSGFVSLEDIFQLTRDLSESLMFNRNVQMSWPARLPAIEVAGGLTLQTQVLVNLIRNALDAVSEIEENSQRWIKVELNEKGGNVEIAVSNGGPALTPRHRTQLFKPFFTTKRTGAGMGIGLALCRELVESVGGEIWYDEHARTPRFVVRYSYLPSIERAHDLEANEHQNSTAA